MLVLHLSRKLHYPAYVRFLGLCSIPKATIFGGGGEFIIAKPLKSRDLGVNHVLGPILHQSSLTPQKHSKVFVADRDFARPPRRALKRPSGALLEGRCGSLTGRAGCAESGGCMRAGRLIGGLEGDRPRAKGKGQRAKGKEQRAKGKGGKGGGTSKLEFFMGGCGLKVMRCQLEDRTR